MKPELDDGVAGAGEAARHRGGRFAASISTLAFLFSGLSFYMSALSEPISKCSSRRSCSMPATAAATSTFLRSRSPFPTTAPTPARCWPWNSSSMQTRPRQDLLQRVHRRAPTRSRSSEQAVRADQRSRPSNLLGDGSLLPSGRSAPQGRAGRRRLFVHAEAHLGDAWQPNVNRSDAWPTHPGAAQFFRTVPYLSEQHLNFRRGTIAMHAKDWKPTAAGSK